jgi:hypothetical protein
MWLATEVCGRKQDCLRSYPTDYDVTSSYPADFLRNPINTPKILLVFCQKKMKSFFELDLMASIEKLQQFKLLDLNKFDSFLIETANPVYEIQESFDEIKQTTTVDQKAFIEKLEFIKNQISNLDDLLYKMDYDSHYLDRLNRILYPLADDIDDELNNLKLNCLHNNYASKIKIHNSNFWTYPFDYKSFKCAK